MSAVGGRRTYTEEELQAALRDIQSGKLGTRRAAVIYGIPRSTLRNKIDEEEGMDDDKELSGAEEEKEVEKALEAPLLSYEDLANSDTLNAFLAKTLGGNADNRDGQDPYTGSEHGIFGSPIQALLLRSLMTSQKGMDGGGDSSIPEVMKRLMAHELISEQLKLQQQNNGDSEKISRPSPSNSVICRTDKSKSESDMETEDSGSNVILKIPSFKPTSSKNGDYRSSLDSVSIVSPSVTSDSTSPPILPGRGMLQKDVKDLIAKSISQKFQQSPEPLRNPIIDFDMKRGRFTPPLGGISVIKTQEPRPYQPPHHQTHQQHQQHSSQHQKNQQQHQQQQQQQQQQQNSNSSGGGKGTRPKRGKYRNYDRDSLVEAVRAVQRGEMSVHRAGSYYGVPHSTLEYKVKERHLMRPRKRDPKPNPVDEKIASLKQNDLRNAAAAAAAAANDKLKSQVIKPPQKYPPTSPNGIKLPMYDPSLGPLGYNTNPFPFWPHTPYTHIPLDYGRTSTSTSFPPNAADQFFASQMIQKLHEDSRTTHLNSTSAAGPNLPKTIRQKAESLLDPTETNGLLDGIIRSSLESGVPGDDKKEDRNVAPENMSNKALLDQLCRNSRLTPLTIFHKDGSSGDEERKDHKDSAAESDASVDRDDDIKPNIHTIELSNDSNDSKLNNTSEENGKPERVTTPRPGMIYLKQELTKPENLKPEMLVRFRDVLQPHSGGADVNRNGITEGSASESESAQD